MDKALKFQPKGRNIEEVIFYIAPDAVKYVDSICALGVVLFSFGQAQVK
jgi:hypothetical protein